MWSRGASWKASFYHAQSGRLSLEMVCISPSPLLQPITISSARTLFKPLRWELQLLSTVPAEQTGCFFVPSGAMVSEVADVALLLRRHIFSR